MNREDQKWLPPAEGTSPRPVFGSDVATRQVIHSSSEPSETSALKEKELGKAENYVEGSWKLFYKDANTAKYVISKH
jgi:hypothetical protein